MTKRWKIILWTPLALLALAVVLVGGAYLLASMVPHDYQPERLSEYDKHQVTMAFYNNVIETFANKSRSREAFSVTYTEKEVNQYLASMDAIVGARPNKADVKTQYGSVYALLGRAGLADPAVHFTPGVLTVMIRSQQFDKMLSAGLKFNFDEKRQLHVGMSGAYVGRLRVPDWIVRDSLMALKPLLQKELDKIESTASQPRKNRGVGMIGFSTAEIGTAIAAAITAIDEKPITSAGLTSKGSRIRITAIDLKEGEITLHFSPVSREESQHESTSPKPSTSAPASSQSRPATSK
ncbi:MAG: hypothetical protein LLG01_10840 [Planctomycetaceae bacterium]|nr:hypothetical protein [Planctomycetaceae bacterium]